MASNYPISQIKTLIRVPTTLPTLPAVKQESCSCTCQIPNNCTALSVRSAIGSACICTAIFIIIVTIFCCLDRETKKTQQSLNQDREQPEQESISQIGVFQATPCSKRLLYTGIGFTVQLYSRESGDERIQAFTSAYKSSLNTSYSNNHLRAIVQRFDFLPDFESLPEAWHISKSFQQTIYEEENFMVELLAEPWAVWKARSFMNSYQTWMRTSTQQGVHIDSPTPAYTNQTTSPSGLDRPNIAIAESGDAESELPTEYEMAGPVDTRRQWVVRIARNPDSLVDADKKCVAALVEAVRMLPVS